VVKKIMSDSKKKKRFFKPQKKMLDNGSFKEESGGSYLFMKKHGDNRKPDAVFVDVNPRYSISSIDKFGKKTHYGRFDKKRNVNKVLKTLGFETPTRQSSFSWSNDNNFESGNGKVTKAGYMKKTCVTNVITGERKNIWTLQKKP